VAGFSDQRNDAARGLRSRKLNKQLQALPQKFRDVYGPGAFEGMIASACISNILLRPEL
jgi:hypothetical protein